ncbi:MAG: RNase adapter RapZ [Clostridia bacterium]|nr:RNase adapter RapZ [Clostridia bacterium]MDD4047543.1 RNase adapter RapZ [Clostridia bacterium]
MSFLIITGLSGAGKTHTIRNLEDLGYFCVDNLPPVLLPRFAELCVQDDSVIEKVAIVIDIRGGRFFNDLFEALDNLREQGRPYEILFLEASTEVLVKRFKETRRRHPLSNQGPLLEEILLERKRMENLREIANKIIDTSELLPKELRTQIEDLYGPNNDKVKLHITVMSFGYKYGIPLDADLVVDVRFLPNPFYVDSLRNMTGCDKEVDDYVKEFPITEEFLQKYYELLTFLLPHYVKEGKTHLVIAIGCTGGRHRSVVLANQLGERLLSQEYSVMVRHRDISKKEKKEKPRW